MTLALSQLHAALAAAGAPEDKAMAAAVEVAEMVVEKPRPLRFPPSPAFKRAPAATPDAPLQPWVPLVGGIAVGALMFAAGMAFAKWLGSAGGSGGMIAVVSWVLLGVSCFALGGMIGYLVGTAEVNKIERELQQLKHSLTAASETSGSGAER